MAVIEDDYVGFGIDPVTGRRHAINHLPVDADWETGIYQLEEGDSVIGGVKGIDNLPLQQLANRTEFLKQEVEKRGAVTFEITIPATGWVKNLDDRTGYPYQIDIQNEIIDDTMFPQVIALPEYDEIVKKAQIYSKVETIDGALKIKAKAIPESEIKAQLTLQGVALTISGGGKVIPSGDVEAGDGLAWSSDGKLAVKIGSGLKFNEDRAVAADTQTVITDDDMLDEDATEQDLKNILLSEGN